MTHTTEELKKILARTSSKCHICGKKVALKAYGKLGKRGAWEIDHSNPRANGGTDGYNNLYAACICCNRSKGACSTRTVRARHGTVRAPLSVKRRRIAKLENAVTYGAGGAGIGSLFGPVGMVAGALIGAHMGHKKNPDE